jgi:tetratricopeptide (TPR) repeat protein
VIRSAIGEPGDGNGSPTDKFCRTLLAADAGIQASFEAGRNRLEAIERDDLAVLADAYWKWRREGSLEEAAHTLMTESGAGDPGYWKLWLGEIHRELGRLDAAEEVYLATLHPNDPYLYTKAWYRLAGLYDDLGDTVRARDAWQRVMIAWENADPELQPHVEEAQARLAALP